MPLKIRLIISSLFIVSLTGASSCLPKRPIKLPHEICVLDWEHQVSLCGMTGGSTSIVEQPVSYLHKSSCRTPENEEKLRNYVHNLEAYADTLEQLVKTAAKR